MPATPKPATPPGRSLLLMLSAFALALVVAGCGLGAGKTPTGISVSVSRDFGARTLHARATAPAVHGEQTAMRLLMLDHTVATRYSGGFVQSIDGLSGGTRDGHPVDWFYYVNGVEAPKGAADTPVHPGDRIWWDLHDWSETDDVPAVVGSFPEPFLHGLDGKRLPVRVECATVQSDPCQLVTRSLRAAGVPAALAAVGTGYEPGILHVLVGAWNTIARNPAAESIHVGPHASGVYARFSADGRTLALLDADGRTTRTLGAGAGLVAATSYAHGAPVWVVTGTDARGTLRAARAFDERSLRGRFAVALAPDGSGGAGAVLALPEASP